MTLIPVVLSILGLVFEAISGFFQNEVRITMKPSTFEMMFCTSFYIGTLSALVWILSGEWSYTYKLFTHSSQALLDQLTISLFSCLGNVFIFMVLTRKGPVALALITTTRKVFSVLISARINHTPLKGAQGLGIAVVCLGLVLECYESVMGKSKHKHPAPAKIEIAAKDVLANPKRAVVQAPDRERKKSKKDK